MLPCITNNDLIIVRYGKIKTISIVLRRNYDS